MTPLPAHQQDYSGLANDIIVNGDSGELYTASGELTSLSLQKVLEELTTDDKLTQEQLIQVFTAILNRQSVDVHSYVYELVEAEAISILEDIRPIPLEDLTARERQALAA